MSKGDVTDYYAVLEIPFDATTLQIQTAFRTKAKQLHPDKNPGKDTTAIFQNLLIAFETLREPDKRREYDRIWRTRFGRPDNSYTRQNSNTKNKTTNESNKAKPSHNENPPQDKPPRSGANRDRLNRKLDQLLAREAHLKQQQHPDAAASLDKHRAARQKLSEEEPSVAQGPWYTAHRPRKRERAAFAHAFEAWQARVTSHDRVLSAAEIAVRAIDDELVRLDREITNVRVEIGIEAFVDGASTFAAGLYPFAQTAYESVRGVEVTPSQLAAGALFGVAAAAVTGLAWRYASGRASQRSE